MKSFVWSLLLVFVLVASQGCDVDGRNGPLYDNFKESGIVGKTGVSAGSRFLYLRSYLDQRVECRWIEINSVSQDEVTLTEHVSSDSGCSSYEVSENPIQYRVDLSLHQTTVVGQSDPSTEVVEYVYSGWASPEQIRAKPTYRVGQQVFETFELWADSAQVASFERFINEVGDADGVLAEKSFRPLDQRLGFVQRLIDIQD